MEVEVLWLIRTVKRQKARVGLIRLQRRVDLELLRVETHQLDLHRRREESLNQLRN
jgi:hypothetical protein